MHPQAKMKNIGIRPGEKINELLISGDESFNAYEFSDHYIILPNNSLYEKNEFKIFKRKSVKQGFIYSSNDNRFLSVEEIKKINLSTFTIYNEESFLRITPSEKPNKDLKILDLCYWPKNFRKDNYIKL